MTRTQTYLLVTCIGLTACTSDFDQCKKYGFEPATSEFAQCLQNESLEDRNFVRTFLLLRPRGSIEVIQPDLVYPARHHRAR